MTTPLTALPITFLELCSENRGCSVLSIKTLDFIISSVFGTVGGNQAKGCTAASKTINMNILMIGE